MTRDIAKSGVSVIPYTPSLHIKVSGWLYSKGYIDQACDDHCDHWENIHEFVIRKHESESWWPFSISRYYIAKLICKKHQGWTLELFGDNQDRLIEMASLLAEEFGVDIKVIIVSLTPERIYD